MTDLADLPIQGVLWDLGGVLYDVDLDRPRRAWAELTGLAGATFDEVFFMNGIWTRLELGQISVEQCLDAINSPHSTAVSAQELASIWNTAIEPRSDHVALVRALKPPVRCGVISNTDPIHSHEVQGHELLAGAVAAWTFSHEVGVEKPHPRIYEVALERLGVEPTRALLVDDKAKNIEAARRLGMGGILYSDRAGLVRELSVRHLIGWPCA